MDVFIMVIFGRFYTIKLQWNIPNLQEKPFFQESYEHNHKKLHKTDKMAEYKSRR